MDSPQERKDIAVRAWMHAKRDNLTLQTSTDKANGSPLPPIDLQQQDQSKSHSQPPWPTPPSKPKPKCRPKTIFRQAKSDVPRRPRHVPRPKEPKPTPSPGPQNALIKARVNMHRLLNDCREFFIACELARMRKARMGMNLWFAFWHEIYNYELATHIVRKVAARIPVVAKLFYFTVKKMCELTCEIDGRIETAESIEELDRLWDEMCGRGHAYCESRRLRVLSILEDLRVDLEVGAVETADADYDQLKQGIFGLDSEGNYDPGDSESKVCQKFSGLDYLFQQPDLAARAGFNSHFGSALQQGAHLLRSRAFRPEEDDHLAPDSGYCEVDGECSSENFSSE
ncbi:hypothetical protein VTO42DRAFT_4830 [Malbranchea cinnamomea]